MRNIYKALLPMILAIGIVGGIFIGKYVADIQLSPEEQKLRTILGLIREQYVDEIDIDSLMEKSIPDMLASLDPHSAYIPKSELTMTNNELESSFGGVGVSFQVINDTVTVVEVVSEGPAEKVGMLAGDQILTANGKNLTGQEITSEDVFSTLRGKEGTKVRLKVKRRSSRKLLEFEVTRGEIPSKSVDVTYMTGKDTGYIRVSKFARNTYNEFLEALADLRFRGAKKFVVDLRGNSGGFMDQAIYMANEFLPAGRMIVYTKGRRPENETMAISDGNGQFRNSEIVVLTNEFSASASEIFAGAIQDNDRGLVIGRRTFGKGLVQNQTMLPDSSAIRLTVARYFTPSGRSIQKEYRRGESHPACALLQILFEDFFRFGQCNDFEQVLLAVFENDVFYSCRAVTIALHLMRISAMNFCGSNIGKSKMLFYFSAQIIVHDINIIFFDFHISLFHILDLEQYRCSQ